MNQNEVPQALDDSGNDDVLPVEDSRSDAELLVQFTRHRDQTAMEAMVRRHGPLVMSVCRSVLWNEHDAADAFQATFMVLLRNAHMVKKMASLASWLHGVALRVAKRARTQSLKPPGQFVENTEMENAGMKTPSPVADAASQETVALIHEEIESLPTRFRLPVILCCLEAESLEAVAARLGWTADSVRGRLQRGREMLRLRLARRGVAVASIALATLLSKQATAQVPVHLVVSTAQSMGGAAVSAQVVALCDGVMKTMLLAKLKIAACLLAAISVVTTGAIVVVPGWLASPVANVGTTAVVFGQPVKGEEPKAAPLEQEGSLEQSIAKVRDRTEPAIVRVTGGQSERGQAACTGVIVTPEGHLLVSARAAKQALKVRLADGRQTTATPLGWSNEFGVALAKLDGDGPWPHVKLDPAAKAHAGQAIVTFAYSAPDRENLKRPLVELEWIDRSAPGLWFMRPDGARYEWKLGGVAFDLQGRPLGIECDSFPAHGTVFANTAVVSSLWNDLAGGKNVDEMRLKAIADASAEPPPPGAGRPADAEARAIAATVHIRFEAGKKGLTGVIISKQGMVATVAHHFRMPGREVIVSLPDGRDVRGEVVGVSFPSDIGLIRITEDGEFPHTEMGDSMRLRPGDECLAIGYGPVSDEARTPEIRRTKVVEPAGEIRSHLLSLDKDTQFTGGDSGAGIFDLEGRLVAIGDPHMGLPWPHENPRVEVLRNQWESLHAPFDQASGPEFAMIEKDLLLSTHRLRDAIVEVQEGERKLALGTIINRQGTIVSKASLLPANGQIACRFADGRVLPATTVKVVREHDLAILKVDAADLTPVEWTTGPNSTETLAAIAGSKPAFGTIALSTHTFSPERGHLRASFHEADDGLAVRDVMADETFTFDSDVAPFGPQPLRTGDILVKIEDRPVRKLTDVETLFDPSKSPIAVAGDRVRLLVHRDEKELELSLILGPRAWPIRNAQSARCSNFKDVLSVATASDVEFLGGPVVNAQGQAFGVAIANRQKGWILVLSAEIVQRVVANGS